jgi:hypothetical protein
MNEVNGKWLEMDWPREKLLVHCKPPRSNNDQKRWGLRSNGHEVGG